MALRIVEYFGLFIFIIAPLDAIYSPTNVKEELLVPAIPYAHLGIGYNITNGELGALLLNSNFDRTRKSVTQISTDLRLVTTTDEALDLLDVGGSLKVSVMLGSGGADVSGAGSYLQQEGDRRNYAELLFNSKIHNFEYRVISPESSGRPDCKRMTWRERGTHIITGIINGGQCIISVKYWLTSMNTESRIKAEAKIAASAGPVSGGVEGSLDMMKSVFGKNANITVSTFCSTIFTDIPTDPINAGAMVERFLISHREQNPNGVPMFLRLSPISEIKACQRHEETKESDDFGDSGRFESEAIEKIKDVKLAFSKLSSCISRFPLWEKRNHLSFIRRLRNLQKKIIRVLVKLGNILEYIYNYRSTLEELQNLKTLYKQGEDMSDVLVEDNFWQDKVASVCVDLEKIWIADETKKENEIQKIFGEDKLEGPTVTYSCKEENLLPGAKMQQPGSNKGYEKSWMWTRSQNANLYGCSALTNSWPMYIFILKPRIHYNITWLVLRIGPDDNMHHGHLFGVQAFLGPADQPTIDSNRKQINFEDFIKVIDYPSQEEIKKIPSWNQDFSKEPQALPGTPPFSYYLSGQVVRKKLNIKQQVGMLLIRNPFRDRNMKICQIELYGTVCEKRKINK